MQMSRRVILLLAMASVFLASMRSQPAFGQDIVDTRISPFDAIRVVDDTLHVQLGEAWYELLGANGVTTAELQAAAAEHWPDAHPLRAAAEHLVAIMVALDRAPAGSRVHLSVRDLETDAQRALLNVPMTRAKHRAIVEANRIAAQEAAIPRTMREHSDEVAPAFAYLAERVCESLYYTAPMLTADEAAKDLDELEWRLEDQFSYLTLRDVDYRAAFDTIRAALGEGIRQDDFAIQLQKLISIFGDGHARIENADWYRPTGWTPFLCGIVGDRIVAFREERDALVDEDHPYIRAINDVPIEMWIEEAAESVPNGSPQWRRRNAVRDVRWFLDLCLEQDIDFMSIKLELENEDRTSTATVTYEVGERQPEFGEWPRYESGMLRGDIGYVRIATMDGDEVERIEDDLRSLAGAVGIIIDVRGNTGGSRETLRRLLPYFLPRDHEPVVVNAARYRLSRSFAADHLEGRFMYRADDPRWTDAERGAIGALHESFVPAWQPSDALFSDWHYMVISPAAGGGGGDAPDFSDRPVCVLMDSHCFSATDIFLSAFGMLDNVTLVGTPSGGGSGRVQSFDLHHSKLTVIVSSMASFRPDGRTFDLHGITPDISVQPSPGFFLLDGEIRPQDDPQLDAARRIIAE